jgi:hypothetical protein
MSASFVRLYRSIGRDPDVSRGGRDLDLNERLKALNTLGHNTGYRPTLVEAHKFHGKSARRRRDVLERVRGPRPAAASIHTRSGQLPPLTSMRAQAVLTPLHPLKSQCQSAVKYEPVKGHARVHNLAPKTSLHKWSRDERDKLTQVYSSMREPQYANLLPDFYHVIASRFLVFYPSRGAEEVVEKLHTMKKHQQLKRPGEIEYWKSVQAESLVCSLDTAS